MKGEKGNSLGNFGATRHKKTVESSSTGCQEQDNNEVNSQAEEGGDWAASQQDEEEDRAAPQLLYSAHTSRMVSHIERRFGIFDSNLTLRKIAI